jgi:hypothetical protein
MGMQHVRAEERHSSRLKMKECEMNTIWRYDYKMVLKLA